MESEIARLESEIDVLRHEAKDIFEEAKRLGQQITGSKLARFDAITDKPNGLIATRKKRISELCAETMELDARLTEERDRPVSVKECRESIDALKAESKVLRKETTVEASNRQAGIARNLQAWETELALATAREQEIMNRFSPGAQRMPGGGWVMQRNY